MIVLPNDPLSLTIIRNDEHIDSKIVSTTDFTTVVLALADDAVRDAIAGDWVKIAGLWYPLVRH
jgi:hypothetical protein